MHAKILLFALLNILLISSPVKSQVVINEFSASNLQYWTDGDGECEDFIELYNNSGAPVDISGYWLSDKLTNPMKWQIPAGSPPIPAFGYRVYIASSKPITYWDGSYYHTTFKFTQDNQEYVVFSDPTGVIIDSYWMEFQTQVNHSRARDVNGTGAWGISTTPTPGASNASVFVDYLAKPQIDLQAGFYNGTQTVTITNTEPNSELRYTTNGSVPTAASALYSGPISVNTTTTIKAKVFPVGGGPPPPSGPFCDQAQSSAGFPSNVACQTAICAADAFCCNNTWDGVCATAAAANGACATCLSSYSPPPPPGGGNYLPSFAETNTYFINQAYTFRTVSVSGQLQQWGAGGGGGWVSVNGTWFNFYTVTMEYFDENGVFQFEIDGELRRHGNDSWAYPQKGMRLHTRDEFGTGSTVSYPLFTAKDRDRYDVVIMKAAGSDNYPSAGTGLQRAHMRDGFAQTVSQRGEMHMDERSYEHQITYLNGQYWGVYEMRERVDADFTDYYYNNNKLQIDMLKYWGGLNVEYGSNAGWVSLYNFITTNSMANQTNYDYVVTQLDPEAFIDNFILNTFLVNSDWLNWNTMWWRGNHPLTPVRWRYALWDLDNTIGLGQNYTGWASTGINSNTVCDAQNMFQNAGSSNGHTAIYTRLLQNEGFFTQYINRYSDLLNTSLHCDTLTAILDEFEANLDPEMPAQIARWGGGGSMTTWHNRIQTMRNWVCNRWDIVMNQIVDCFDDVYDISGPYDITIVINGPGSVQLNTINIPLGPWTGTYFGGLDLSLLALADANGEFLNWEIGNYTGQDLTAIDLWTILSQNDTIVANFELINPLPVEWLSFTGEVKQGDGHLYWSTATETNSSHFEIQRTSNGASYTTIGTVTAAGNSVERSDYNFIDESKPEGRQYYRLKQIDFNGEYDYSSPITLDYGLGASALLIAPNPNNGNFELLNRSESVTSADLYDPHGKLIRNLILQPNQSLSVNLSEESAGVYLIRHNLEHEVRSYKVVVY